MKRTRVLVVAVLLPTLLLCCLVGFAETQPSTNAIGFQIGTFNLGFFTDLDPTTGEWCEENNDRTLVEVDALAAFIDSLGIEILALQEVECAAALDLLLRTLPEGKYAYAVSSQEDQCQRVAVLYRPAEASVTPLTEIPLTLGIAGLRDGLVVKVEMLQSGFDFTLVIVHLKSGSDGIATRLEQLRALGTWVANYLAVPSNDPDLVLAGDFNEAFISNPGVFALLDGSSSLRLLTSDAPCLTCTPQGHRYTDPIDHIVVSPSVSGVYSGETVFLDYFSDSTMAHRNAFSDHCVLWSTFSVSGPSSTCTLTYAAGVNGSVTGANPQIVEYGASGTAVTAVPITGCRFDKWSDGVLTATRTDGNVTANKNVTATFVPNCTFTLLALTSPAEPGHDASITIRTMPGSSCSIHVRYKSGYGTAKGITGENMVKVADSSGDVSWTWMVGPNTTPGIWQIELTNESCSVGTALPFEVR